MGEYKPLGSEKLNGDEKLKRILELTYYNQNNKKSSIKPELVKEGRSGKVYGIVKEKDGYYVKMGLNEQTLDYIGGLFMKNKNRYSSYAEALKRLELLRGQDTRLNENTKYVIKQTNEQPEGEVDAATAPVPDAAPAPDASAAPVPDASAAPTPAPDASAAPTPAPDASAAPTPDAATKPSDYMTEVQKFAGKLGQELRDQKEKMESDDIKYVLNMIISAVDLEKLDIEDLEEIGKKFDRDEEDMTGDEMSPEEEPSAEEPAQTEEPGTEPEPDSQTDLTEEDPMKALEEFINSEIDLTKEPTNTHHDKNEKVVEVDMNEIKSEVNDKIDEILKKYFK